MLQPRGQSFRIVGALFLRLLGLVYLIAFGSLWTQIAGLVGANGIAPVAATLLAVRADYGLSAYWYVPSLYWLWPTDAMLIALCAAGCFAAAAMIAGVLPRWAALAAYVLYLSLVSIGEPFTSFQWDTLLLETGFLAVFTGSPFSAWAYRFLLFRLMFMSGWVKLSSGDPTWRSLRALRYHFWTQPLPNPVAYCVAHWPDRVLDVCCFLMLAIELVAPFFVFAWPKRVRHWAAGFLIGLQILIALTGNFAFFNLLTMLLCLWAFDDSSFSRIPVSVEASWPRVQNACVAGLIVLAVWKPSILEPMLITNSYGLFAVMTTSRTELVIEGSNDGEHWRPYSFRYKPGDVRRGLPVIAPLQPRLDWQMWFAALNDPRYSPWIRTLVYRLLRGDSSVLNLLDHSPFSQPPRSIRIAAYSYRFSTGEERALSGAVWQRKYERIWLDPISLPEGN